METDHGNAEGSKRSELTCEEERRWKYAMDILVIDYKKGRKGIEVAAIASGAVLR